MNYIYTIVSILCIGNTVDYLYVSKQSITLILKKNITISKKIVNLYDVTIVNNYIKNIDIAELKPNQNTLIISKKHILLRLMLYDNRYNYDILGPDYVEVKYISDSNINKYTFLPGKKVTLYYKKNGIEIITTAELIQAGKIGEMVKLRIGDTSRIITALLIDENNAIIE
ncbi:MAG: flagella basal body P-ring formation protein FlgA [Thermogemmata sp.]|jgi:hypothetical protein|uniref:Flagella basal body P-ring formation protein FlgA n=1 Tax=Thermogemmata fonticola TaxID=2755323 RepID=A0A7V8VF01_9BACT|nr:flagella basal body P-ring formation protein FlgA [Thermogemmata fonticola]MBA2226572.1 flagella basal body P-ring formation protein FlgA [Thermogemmata fonticola]MCX8140868.1 flagella basal body P-ring formation protein FlgA [Gemmataceae bacterium]GIW85087.1 MAG: hypothetical protein KatS3mg107_0747 [Gemmataceae bacterium]